VAQDPQGEFILESYSVLEEDDEDVVKGLALGGLGGGGGNEGQRDDGLEEHG